MKKSTKLAIVLATSATAVSSVASADTAADISAAFTSGQANVALVATGIIAMAAIMTGVGMVVRWISK